MSTLTPEPAHAPPAPGVLRAGTRCAACGSARGRDVGTAPVACLAIAPADPL
jgi:hypothetical protein